MWHWWRFEGFLTAQYKPILYEIKIPKDIAKPVRAMEDVMTSLHGIVYHWPNWWEEWIDGQFQTSLSFEIVSTEGDIRFFVRMHRDYIYAAQAAIYSQYSDVEITPVDDYTKAVPQDIPNRDWDLWGTGYTFLRNGPGESAYPIGTYKKFEKEVEPDEEKIVDPISGLLESLADIGPGEHFWIQIRAMPITSNESSWIKDGMELRNKAAKRTAPSKPQFKPMALEAVEMLVTGKLPEEKKKEPEGLIAPELRLTPGERDIVAAIEEKISKPGFVSGIRFIYLGKRENFEKAKLRLGFTFFTSFFTNNLNALIPYTKTLTKIAKQWFLPINLLRSRRLYLRQRRIFRNYVNRIGPFYPRPTGKGKFMLNTEELASLFHFPSWRVAPVPGVARIEAKRKAPPDLPKE
jgi:hypothetical protein